MVLYGASLSAIVLAPALVRSAEGGRTSVFVVKVGAFLCRGGRSERRPRLCGSVNQSSDRPNLATVTY